MASDRQKNSKNISKEYTPQVEAGKYSPNLNIPFSHQHKTQAIQSNTQNQQHINNNNNANIVKKNKNLLKSHDFNSQANQKIEQEFVMFPNSTTNNNIDKNIINKKLQPQHKKQNSCPLQLQNIIKQQQQELKQCEQEINLQNKQLQKNKKKSVTYQLEETQLDKKEIIWSELDLPISPQEAIKQFKNYLTNHEQEEILKYDKIYFLGYQCIKKNSQNGKLLSGYDSKENSEYIYKNLDHIAYRYEIVDTLGKGSFGQVLKVYDHKEKSTKALKIIANKQKLFEQSKIEIELLQTIQVQPDFQQSNIIGILDNFVFRNHVCIVTELLSVNLFDLMQKNQFNPLSMELIRRIAIQLLNSIHFIHKLNIIHCDIKPENILLKQENKSGIKLIDFGSSCYEDQQLYTYIQSRFYRAPEVMLGCSYNKQIDMWSFGCVIAELIMGYPIFPGETEQESVGYMNELLGIPPIDMLNKAVRKQYFYTENNEAIIVRNKMDEELIPQSKSFQEILETNDEQFIDFIKICLIWDPTKRATAKQALLHPWILNGLPQNIREQHIQILTSEGDYKTQTDEQTSYILQTENIVQIDSPNFEIEQNQNIMNNQQKQQKNEYAITSQILDLEQNSQQNQSKNLSLDFENHPKKIE
ncbi:Protein kinase-like domain [Pseudocohnilembus persalinus]|uniref:dual-specificity kinase n=1 Tax=Pseudocohnilembus persalinus TaxID=266149 RepID=A0A0V0QXD4_PSEPJ|nr:Protein kinase-like domain [Pseudocohnilembus persalinus]|eukprot:KRX06852.1 Protein kinase-like domain [Pseudocohnilembus persalinus]